MGQTFKAGDPVIYRMDKHSARPGPRARDVRPASQGDTYSYSVDKFWRVKDVRNDGRVVLYTRRGKVHVCDPSDIHLRKAGVLERLVYWSRFPDESAKPSPGTA
jgi:hypothetical protein